MFGYLILEGGDSDADIVLPDSTIVACDPWFLVAWGAADCTADTTDDFGFFLLLNLLLLGSFLLGFGGRV